MAEFLTSTKLSSFKSNSFILCWRSLSSWSVLHIFSLGTLCLIFSMCFTCLAKARTYSPINSVLETILPRYFTSYVASTTSRDIVGYYDLAKQLSHFLFFFCFLFFYLVRSLLRWSVGKYHVTVTQSHIWLYHKVTVTGHRSQHVMR